MHEKENAASSVLIPERLRPIFWSLSAFCFYYIMKDHPDSTLERQQKACQIVLTGSLHSLL